MNIDEQELYEIYKVLIRELKEIGIYTELKNTVTKKKLFEILRDCSSEKNFVDYLWSFIDRLVQTIETEFHGPRASLLYLNLVRSKCFKKALAKHLPNVRLSIILGNEKKYINFNLGGEESERLSKFLSRITERELDLYKEIFGNKKCVHSVS